MPFPRLSLKDAKRLAEEMFPQGPEGIADAMGVEVERSDLSGADGWCIQRDGHAPKIRINSKSYPTRQRFTLAHELAHLLLGTDPEIISQSILPFQSVKKEEREADKLAAELLIPLAHLKKNVGGVPVDAFSIKKLARKSAVSDVVAAGRIVVEAQALGLVNGALAAFKGGECQWGWSPSLRNVKEAAIALYPKAQASLPKLFRTKPDANGSVTTATVVGSPEYPVLVLQLLPANEATKQTHHERARELDEALFRGDASFRQSFSGALGFFKQKAQRLDLETATAEFNSRYGKKWDGDLRKRLFSAAGQTYLRHRLVAWTHAE